VHGQSGPGGIGDAAGAQGQPELLFWYDASGMSLSNGSSVSLWPDISGNGNDALQTDISGQPTFQQGQINGLPVVSFDGNNDFLPFDGSLVTNSDYTVVFVGRRRTNGSFKAFMGGTTSGTNQNLHLYWYNNTQFRAHHYGNDLQTDMLGSAEAYSSGTEAGEFGIFTTLLASSDANNNRRNYQNNAFLGARSDNSTLSSYVGAAIARYNSGYHDVDAAEVIVFKDALNEAQLQIVHQYLNEKYAINIANDLYDAGAYGADLAGIGEESNGAQEKAASGGMYLTALSGLGVGDYVFVSHDNAVNNSSNFRDGTEITNAGAQEAYNRLWLLEKINSPTAQLAFDFSEALDDGEHPVNVENYVLLYRSGTSGDFSIIKNADGIINGDQVYFDLNDVQLQSGYYTLGTQDASSSPLEGTPGKTWYTLISGDWEDWEVWTLDPSGALPNNPNQETPVTSSTASADNVVIRTGRTVTVNSSNLNNASITVDGRLDLQNTSNHTFGEIRGTGRILMADDNFPAGDATHFISKGLGEGTVEFYGGTYDLEKTREFFDVEVDLDSDAEAITLLANYQINGDLRIDNGILKINDVISTDVLNIEVNGNMSIGTNGGIRTGRGDTRAGYQIGGTMPADDGKEYHAVFHQLEVYGNFENRGIVRFTNLNAPDYNTLAANGAVSVRFKGASNASVDLYNTTDFYNLIIDKGIDKSYKVNLYADNTTYFRLYGANSVGRTTGAPFSTEDPQVRKALWIHHGTLQLRGNVDIPSLTEGAQEGGNGDYAIGKSARLWLDGSNVTVYTTANEVSEVTGFTNSDAYSADGVNASSSNQALSVYGEFKISDGYFSTRDAAGFVFWAASNAQLKIEGGTCYVAQVRSTSSGSGVASYVQSGGDMIVFGNEAPFGGEYTGSYPLFGLESADAVFQMTGGTITLQDDDGDADPEFYVIASEGNYQVTGGSVIFEVQNGRTAQIQSTANLYNLEVRNTDLTGNATVELLTPLTAMGDVLLNSNTSFVANGYDFSIGDDFDVADGAGYLHGGNTTYFVGNRQSTINIRNTDTENYLLFNDLVLSKDQRYNTSLFHAVEVRSGGSRANNLSPLLIDGNLTITRGEFDVNDWLVHLHGNINIVDGQILASGTPAGHIVLNGGAQQTLKGSFTKEQAFGSFELDNASGAKLLSDINVQDFTLTQGVMDLDIYNLDVNGSISTTGTFDENLMFRTAGNAGDGGITRYWDLSAGAAGTTLLFPMGTGTIYAPAILTQTESVADAGSFTVNPVSSYHPALKAGSEDKSIPYYWVVDTLGFTNLNYDQIEYSFEYSGAIPNGVKQGANLWDGDWQWYDAGNVLSGNTLNFPNTSYLTEEFTLGNPSIFKKLEVYYSTTVGAGNDTNFGTGDQWDDPNRWSTVGHYSTVNDGTYPQKGDIAIIGFGLQNSTAIVDNAQRSHWFYVDADVEVGKVIFANEVVNADGVAVPRTSSYLPQLIINDDANLDFIAGTVSGEGTFNVHVGCSVCDSDPTGTTPVTANIDADFSDFANNANSRFDYDLYLSDNTTAYLPESFPEVYPNVHVKGQNGSNRKLVFREDILIKGDLTIRQNATVLLSNTQYGDIEVLGDLDFTINEGDDRLLFPTSGSERTFTLHGDVIMEDGDNDVISVSNTTPSSLEHIFKLGGNIIKESGNTIDLFSDNSGGNNVVLELFGEANGSYTSDDNPAELYRIVMNKEGAGNADFLFDDAFTLNGPTNSEPKALELISGRLMLSDPGIDITLSSGGPDFDIPAEATLYTGQSAVVRITGDNTGIWLDGHIHAGWDTKWYLNGGINNYIEYSSSGNAEIDIYQAEFYVGSQIRRSTTSEEGILRFQQQHANSTVVIGTNAHLGGERERGIFELVNSGSYFSQVTGAELSIANVVDNSVLPAFYLDLDFAEVNIEEGSSIRFGNSQTASGQIMGLYASVPLRDFYLDNTSGNAPILQLNTLPHSMDMLTIEGSAVFDASGLDLTLYKDLVVDGIFQANENNTYFAGTTDQQIAGSGSPVFWNLYKTNTNDLTLNDDVEVANELHLESGTFTDGDNSLSVQGYVWMDVTHNWGGSSEGIVLNGSENQVLTGTGTFGKLTIINPQGVNLPAGSEFTISGALQLEQGVLNIGKNLLNLTETATIIEGNAFSENNMIQTNISFTDAGVKKFYPAISSATSFVYPIGSKGKYTPVELNISQMNSGGAIRVKAADEIHPTIVNDNEPCQEIVDTANVLRYHWLVEASDVTGFIADAQMQYYADDFQDNSSFYDESDYIAARLLYGSTLWNKYDETSFDETNQLLRFSFSNTDDNGISGDYTAGVEDPNGTCEGAIPDEVPAYITTSNGNWTDESIWETYPMPGGTVPAGGPRGAIVIVEHEVTIPVNYILNYKTRINASGIIKVGTTFGHRLGIVEGTGTLQLERGSLPAGIYDDFFSRSGGTLEYAGSNSYDVLSEVTALRNLKFSGTGDRRLPNLDFEVYGEFTIAGDDATLEVINEHDRNITLDSTITFTQGAFDAGIGNSRVIINGTTEQVINGDFTGSNAFWDFGMNNSKGLVLNGAVEIDNDLIFTDGVIQTDAANILTINNSATNAVTGYGSTAYVDGPMQKLVNSGDDFVFPLGDGTRYGWMEILSTSSTSAGLWEAEYFNANPDDAGLDTSKFVGPLQAVSGNEYWRVAGPEAGSAAFTKIRWDQNSILPAATDNRENNLVLAEWNSGSAEWQSVGEDVVDLGISDGNITSDNQRTLAERYYTLGSKEVAPLPTAGFLTADTTICAGSTISLRIQVDGNPDFSVVVDDGTSTNTYSGSSNYITFDATPASTITYTIVEVIEDTDGTPVSSTTTIWGDPVTVEVIPVPDNTFVITPSGNASYCQGSSGIEVGLDGSESGVTYQLLLDGAPIGSTAAGTGSAISFGMQTVEGTYTVQGTNQGDTNADCARLMSGSLILTENALPVVALSVNPSFDRVCDGDNTEISVDFTGTGPYDFTITNGITTETVSSGGDDPYTYIPLTAPVWLDDGTPDTEYTYSITSITDANGCTNTATQGSAQVTVYKVPETGPQYHISNEHAR
jgi:hypothetical protein